MRTLKYDIDIYREQYEKIKCMQYDDLNLQLKILENCITADLDGYTAILNWVKPDSTIVVLNNNKVTISSNVINITLPRDCTRVEGVVNFEVVLTKDAKQTTTFPLQLEVKKSVFVDQEVSKNVISSIEDLKENVVTAGTWHNTLQSDITTASSKHTTLQTDISTANTSKSALNTSKNNADSSKVALDGSIATAQGLVRTLETTPFTVAATDWQGIDPDFTYTLEHNLGTKNVIVQIINADTGERMPDDYKVIDNNSILLRNRTKQNLTAIVINYKTYIDTWTAFQQNGGKLLGGKLSFGVDSNKVSMKTLESKELEIKGATHGVVTTSGGIEPSVAQCNLGSSATVFKDVFLSGSSIDINSESGQIKLPNGFMFKWGVAYLSSQDKCTTTSDGVTLVTRVKEVTFPTTFLNNCFNVIINSQSVNWRANAIQNQYDKDKFTVEAFQLHEDIPHTGDLVRIFYMAIGN